MKCYSLLRDQNLQNSTTQNKKKILQQFLNQPVRTQRFFNDLADIQLLLCRRYWRVLRKNIQASSPAPALRPVTPGPRPTRPSLFSASHLHKPFSLRLNFISVTQQLIVYIKSYQTNQHGTNDLGLDIFLLTSQVLSKQKV